MVTNLKLYETWLQKVEIIRDMVTNLKLRDMVTNLKF